MRFPNIRGSGEETSQSRLDWTGWHAGHAARRQAMQAVLCDICEHPIRGKAFEFQIIRGEAVNTEQGQPRIVQREGSQMMHVCSPCGYWIMEAMAHLRQMLSLAEGEAAHAGGGLRRTATR